MPGPNGRVSADNIHISTLTSISFFNFIPLKLSIAGGVAGAASERAATSWAGHANRELHPAGHNSFKQANIHENA